MVKNLILTKLTVFAKSEVDMGRTIGLKNVSLERLNEIIATHQAGLEQSEITNYYGMPQYTPKSIIRCSERSSNNTDSSSNGRKPK